MAVQLNHTIVWSTDQTKSARFLAEMLGRSEPARLGHFDVVELDNGVSLDFADVEGPIRPQHYAFHRDGGRGVYFPDPDGHNLEVITRPYGSGAG